MLFLSISILLFLFIVLNNNNNTSYFSIYDDVHTYGVAGSLKFPKEEKKAAPKAKAAAKEAPKKLMQVYR
jgi:hypothetical protein